MEILNLSFQGFYINLDGSRETRDNYTYKDLVEHGKLTHYHSKEMEELVPLVGKFDKNGNFIPKFSIDFCEVVDNRLKHIESNGMNEYHQKVKSTIWAADRFIKNNMFMNWFSEYDILVLTADDSEETLIATKRKITKDPLHIFLGILGCIFTPLILLFLGFKKIISSLLFISENNLWTPVMMMIFTLIACLYSSTISENLASANNQINEVKEMQGELQSMNNFNF